MDFGLSYDEMLGFGECWFAEHHFTDYSILPSPNLMIAAALPRTQRLRFGNYVNGRGSSPSWASPGTTRRP